MLKLSFKGVLKRLILVLTIISIVFILTGCSILEEDTTELFSNAPAVYTTITVDELENALDNNSATAKETYNGKYLEITGKFGVIDADLEYFSLDSTTNNFDLDGIHCSLKNDEQKTIVKTLNKDDIITVRGKITDVGEIMGYYLDVIEIIKQ